MTRDLTETLEIANVLFTNVITWCHKKHSRPKALKVMAVSRWSHKSHTYEICRIEY